MKPTEKRAFWIFIIATFLIIILCQCSPIHHIPTHSKAPSITYTSPEASHILNLRRYFIMTHHNSSPFFYDPTIISLIGPRTRIS